MNNDKRKPGRPALPPGAAKSARVELRVTPAVKAAWYAAARAAGMTLQAWIERHCVVTCSPAQTTCVVAEWQDVG